MIRSWIEAKRLSDRPTTALLGEEGFSAPTLVLTTFELDEFVYEALRAGASGFLVKRTEPAELIRAVHVVAAG